MSTKYIFVTGGVVSSLGKGITAASLGRLLKNRGYKVTIQKFDPYINIDPGTMSPYQHGEVFVTDDGAETDLDLGHYERFIDINLGKTSNITAGKVYWSVINKERKGEYLGSTVQVIPHITNEIKNAVFRVGKEDKADVVITEIGGTVGDIESLPFLEAIRQVKKEVNRDDVLYIHVTLVPYISAAGELKTKPLVYGDNLFFKDEVRALGTEMGMPDEVVWRQPFPGPGLAIRVMGEITEEKLETVRESDAILREEIAKAGLERDVWQYFTVNTGVRSVGVMGDGRTYDYTIAIRAITSIDGMTADFAKLPWEVLQKISVRIVNEVDHVNRIVYDITSKPPATVEWE